VGTTQAKREREATTIRFLGPDPVEQQLAHALEALANGRPPRDIERLLVDCKEEPGRRAADGTIVLGNVESEQAAKYFAEEAACFANTPSGGAIIIGIADDGTRIGSDLDSEWLRHRIYELTERRLTVTVRAGELDGARILVLIVPEALEPVPYRNRLRWRVGDHCVQVDSTSWWSGRLTRLGHDWSANSSNHPVEAARPAAIDVARMYLRASQDPRAEELADLSSADLMARTNAVTGDGHLTNAAALLFVGRGAPAIDYIRRDQPGGDSRVRLRQPGLSLLEELAAVEQAISAYNPLVHLPSGLAVGQISVLPPLSIREATVNGLAHRDWTPETPTTIEHVGTTLVVSSPGGFIGGVTADNIITHPSAPRHRALAELLSKLRIAEREGVGVDRMIRDMLRLGYARPAIEEMRGPFVRTALVGEAPDVSWMRFLNQLQPPASGTDLDLLLLMDQLVKEGWTDAARAAPLLQKSVLEAKHALARLDQVTQNGAQVVVHVAGATQFPARRLSDSLRRALAPRLREWLPPAARARLVLGWARHRGRVSTTEVAAIVGIGVNLASELLRSLEDQGLLSPGRSNRTGRGFFYVPATPEERVVRESAAAVPL
jgi:ATP-dependent DNA helicase RecG